MPVEITMPRLSDTMESGTVVKWYKNEGDQVASGDVVADVETDKAVMELQAFDDGVLAKQAVREGESVAVGTVIALLAESGEDPAEVAKSAGKQAASSGGGAEADTTESKPSGEPEASGNDEAEDTPARAEAAPEPASETNGRARVFASPLARKIAEERGLDLSKIEGSGPSGRIVRRDVEDAQQGSRAAASASGAADTGSAASAPRPAPVPAAGASLESKRVPLSGMRATIAKRLVESKTTVPHYQVTVSARLDALESLREQLNEQLASQGVKLSVNDFLVRACALAMHSHPFVNSSWNAGDGGGPSIDLHGEVNVGVAIALPEERGGGLVVGTIYHADQQGLRTISAETKRLAKKARDKGLSPQEMSGSTFTISNLGMFGVDHFTAIINPPNAAILAVGRAVEKPFIEADDDGEFEMVLGKEMSMTMSSDHRIIDGAMAAQYLNTVKSLLESPAALLV